MFPDVTEDSIHTARQTGSGVCGRFFRLEWMAKNVLKRQDLRVLQSTLLDNASLFILFYINLIIAFLKLKL